MLSHFVGDLHQPRHVGAVYLDANNVEATGSDATETGGGNALTMTKNENLWDDVGSERPRPTAIHQACLISPFPIQLLSGSRNGPQRVLRLQRPLMTE